MDRDAEFERIVNETQVAIRAFVAGTGVSRDRVDDIAQDVYLEFYRKMDALPPDTAPVRWLKGIARHRCLDHFRNSKRRNALREKAVAALMLQQESACEDLAGRQGVTVHLRKCVERLTDRSRKMVALYYKEDKTSEEVGHLMQVTAASVRKSLLRIRGTLKTCIEQALVEEPV